MTHVVTGLPSLPSRRTEAICTSSASPSLLSSSPLQLLIARSSPFGRAICQGATFHARLGLPNGWRRSVFRVADVVLPCRAVALFIDLEHRDVSHEAYWRSAVPVILTRLEEHTVAGADDLDRCSAALGETNALGHIDGLSVRVPVPRRSRARREVNAAGRQTRSV